MFKWLVRIFGRLRRPSIHREGPERPAAPLSVLLWGPSYDAQTHHTAKWLANLKIPDNVTRHTLIGPSMKSSDIESLLRVTQDCRQLAIFCGHGIVDALLGPPQGDANDLAAYDGRHSQIYKAVMMPGGPTLLFAFCCRAARGLGLKFASLPNRAFLGYDDDLLLNVRDEECSETWKRIIETISGELIEDGDILPKHEKDLKQLYEAAFEYFRDGEGRNNPESTEMQMSLLRQAARIRRYEGAVNVSHI